MSHSLPSPARVFKISFCDQAPLLRDAKNKGSTPPIQIMGQWVVFIDKANTIIVQRYVVPWMIALYRMSYQKNMKQELVKEMAITLSGTFDFAPFDLDEAAEEYPVGIAEVTKRIKSAAGTLSRDFHTR